MVNNNLQWRNPRGLIYGLLSVALGQIFIIIPYYYLLRKEYIQRPFIQKKNKKKQDKNDDGKNNNKTFFEEMKNHLFQPEGFFLLGTYLSVTWIFNFMPDTYYNLEEPVNLLHVLLQLLVVDFFQTIMHFGEHYIANFYIKSHKPHHVFKSPRLFDAFDGSFMDTICMILIPLYITANIVHTNMWSYALFGTIYGNYLCLIHSEYSHIFDPIFRFIGVGTAGDHHVHHKLFKYNYGHLFMIWDRFLFRTYKSPLELKKHFNVSELKIKERDIFILLNFFVGIICFPILSMRVYQNAQKRNGHNNVLNSGSSRKYTNFMPRLTDTKQVAELGILFVIIIYLLGFSGMMVAFEEEEEKMMEVKDNNTKKDLLIHKKKEGNDGKMKKI